MKTEVKVPDIFLVSTFANNLSTQKDACSNAFSNCRKTQDSAGAIISACSQSPNALTSKLKGLTSNLDLVNQSQKALGSVKSRVFLSKQAVVAAAIPVLSARAALCSDLLAATDDMLQALKENPASQKVGDFAKDVVNLTATVVCSAADLADIAGRQSDVAASTALIQKEVEEVQNDLEGRSSDSILSKLCPVASFSPSHLM
jgi:hypothetical protein